ncbi:sensor histidine kinase [Paenibacillus aurantiacus]|uniref:histidine kinase n=1 Tax=Paenibacillus aurantiacus TaxID=1936118 RepID=A0ABV5KZZ6_9BACL
MIRHTLRSGFKQVTFKNRIITIFIVSSLIPFICLGMVSFYTIDSIITNKVESSIKSELEQDLLAMENTLNNLNHVSQQIAFDGGTNKLIERLQGVTEPYEKLQLRNEIKSELNVIVFSNPNVGLTMYYAPDTRTYDFENFFVRDNRFEPSELPVMARYPEITYFGPHLSINRSINQPVISTMRRVNLPEQNLYLYIETGFNVLKNILEPAHEQISKRRLLILDNDDRVAYSQVGDRFPQDRPFPRGSQETVSGTYGSDAWYIVTSNQGWSLVSVLPTDELNREKNQWLLQITGFFLFFLLAAALTAWILWKMVYRPLDRFNKEIKSLLHSNVKASTDAIHIPEFDYLLYQIRNMKTKIWDLYGEIEQKEKRRADLEVEKLLYQINPHFLMNTLDTVHWLATMNGQKEIDKLVLSLNRLLNYNLGKMGEATTIGAEIEALKEYLTLQQIRYDFRFDVDIDVEEEAMSFTIPRFILQPLVENSLYHGVSDDGYIHVNIQLAGELKITIQDNGAGMSQERIDQLLLGEAEASKRMGMGIGMRYVKRVLEANYGEQARFALKSEVGKGTTVSLIIPVNGAEER